MIPRGCRLPLRPPMPTDSFLPRTLGRDDVTVPPGVTAASATGFSLTTWHAAGANAQKGAKQ